VGEGRASDHQDDFRTVLWELKVRTAMKKLRIVILGFGTARQKMVLER
jgi:hypothetical protein